MALWAQYHDHTLFCKYSTSYKLKTEWSRPFQPPLSSDAASRFQTNGGKRPNTWSTFQFNRGISILHLQMYINSLTFNCPCVEYWATRQVSRKNIRKFPQLVLKRHVCKDRPTPYYHPQVSKNHLIIAFWRYQILDTSIRFQRDQICNINFIPKVLNPLSKHRYSTPISKVSIFLFS